MTSTTKPYTYGTVEAGNNGMHCGHVVCDPDYLHCCRSPTGVLRCCANANRPSTSNNFKWPIWVGGGIVIGVVVFLTLFLLHRRTKANFHKQRRGRRAYAPAQGMASTSSGTLVTDGCDLETGSAGAHPAPATGDGMPPTAGGMSASIHFPTDGPPRVECRNSAAPPPYSCDGGGGGGSGGGDSSTANDMAVPEVAVSARSSAVLAGEHQRHFDTVNASVAERARRLPHYQDIVDSPTTDVMSSLLSPSSTSIPRLVFVTQTSHDQLLPGDGGNRYDLDTPPTPPPGEDLLEPPPAYHN